MVGLSIGDSRVGISIYVRMMASIPFVRVNGDIQVGF